MAHDLHQGGCVCGKVRYRLTDKPLIVHACHCRTCQRLTGSTNVVNVLIEPGRLDHLSGDLTDTLVETPSGSGQRITRCASCLVAVWSEYLIFAKKRGAPVLFIRAGTLDQPDAFPPDVHIFAETMQPHFRPDPDTPQYPKFYDIPRFWPRSSLDRLFGKPKSGSDPAR